MHICLKMPLKFVLSQLAAFTMFVEDILKDIIKLSVNIDGDRETYAGHFDIVKKGIIGELKKDPVFSRLFFVDSLEGSYGDNIKIQLPNEFDLVIKFQLPEMRLLKISKDPQMPGNVLINLEGVLRKICREKQNRQVCYCLRRWVDAKYYLRIDPLQSWLQSRFAQAVQEFATQHRDVKLKYSRQGPAHTISLTAPFTYSIDFVPAIQMLAKDNPFISGSEWIAIPKPLKGQNSNSEISYRASHFDDEHALLNNKKNLKNVLRLMKKWRDAHSNLHHLKSYFLKTIFLWKIKQVDPAYWQNSLSFLLAEMFEELRNIAQKEKLPYFWDDNLNMFKDFRDTHLQEIIYSVRKVQHTLSRAMQMNSSDCLNDVLQQFLTSNEKQQFYAYKKLI